MKESFLLVLFLLCKELEQDSSGKSSPRPCVEALIPRTVPFFFLNTMQFGFVSASIGSHLGCLFTNLSFGFFGVNSPCIGRKLLHGICWCKLVITPTSCACVRVLFLYEQKMKLLDKVVNVFTHKKRIIQTVWWFFYFVHKNPTLFGWVFLSDFFCFMLTLMFSLNSEGTPSNKG